jgi:hypothetical protein
MRRRKLLTKAMLAASLLFAGGTILSNGCINTLASINLCGTVFTFCTPVDQLNLLYPLLEVPDWDTDPSCTLPFGCSDTDIRQGLEGVPAGDGTPEPEDAQGGGLGGGGGGGGI